MRFLLLFMWPVLGYSQLDTTMTFRQIEVHSIVIRADTSVLWDIDTLRFESIGEIKFNKVKKTISIDRYGVYKVTKYEIHGVIEPHLPEHGRIEGHHYYELSNGSNLTWIENAVIWDWPIVKKKTQTVIFEIK